MSLTEVLSPWLPKSDTPYHVLNVSSQPKKCKRIFYSKEKQTTIKAQHFITISQGQRVIFGIELFIYIILYQDRTERVLFVSKADTSGLFNVSLTGGVNIKVAEVTRAIVSYILKLPLSYYLDQVLVLDEEYSSEKRPLDVLIARYRANKSLEIPLPTEKHKYKYIHYDHIEPVVNKISLFTRPEPQYLFPYSAKNKGKHVLSGDQLLRWWCKIINSVAITDFESPLCKLLVPGAESRTIKRYFPNDQWQVGDVFSEDNNDLAIYKIPFFPDDPKLRFVEHLISENRIKRVKMDQFWLELSVRQEFRLGIVVGVVGISGALKQSLTPTPVGDIKKLPMKSLKRVKQSIIEEDYSIPEELQSYQYISRSFPDLITPVNGTFTPIENPKKHSITPVMVPPTMMVIKRKKKQ